MYLNARIYTFFTEWDLHKNELFPTKKELSKLEHI